MAEKTFFIIDDYPMVRQGIIAWFTKNSDWVCVGDASSLGEARKALLLLSQKQSLPQVLIEDLSLGKDDGLTFVKEVKKTYPELKCIVYSMYARSGIVEQCLAAGAVGFVSKSASEQEFEKALNVVYEGDLYIEQKLLAPLVSYKDCVSSLTKREREVFELTLAEKKNCEIAEQLGLEKRAVENYISRIYSKMDCKSHEELCKKFGLNFSIGRK